MGVISPHKWHYGQDGFVAFVSGGRRIKWHPCLMVTQTTIQNKHVQIHSHNEPTQRNASDRDDERGKILAMIRRNVLLHLDCKPTVKCDDMVPTQTTTTY